MGHGRSHNNNGTRPSRTRGSCDSATFFLPLVSYLFFFALLHCRSTFLTTTQLLETWNHSHPRYFGWAFHVFIVFVHRLAFPSFFSLYLSSPCVCRARSTLGNSNLSSRVQLSDSTRTCLGDNGEEAPPQSFTQGGQPGGQEGGRGEQHCSCRCCARLASWPV